ncbi:dihydrofolate reductase family protein [Umezawaea endophytica]|uniref:Dihydrofolate reductase family protein n=1 Tax=Umezawaea endophytica TaxID=1654476 RepID=A0A9X2VFT0_9PSEU|nr:dihydrofolate reductase family protein [Umezawaea endophytica]MCS7475654.1 dihydrofolate reductase family protein [Umezawaea endophytica]
MSTVYCDLAISLDGFLAGPDQRPDTPLGEGGILLHRWKFDEPELHARENAAVVDAGAFVMGRNMFAGPGQGPWDPDWTGWWGAEPPYHGPVFVLTHHAHEPIPLEGGTTFHFVTGGVDEALDRAREAAGGRAVSIAGGAATANQYLAAGLVDELRLHLVPVLLGRGERLFDGVPHTGLVQVDVRPTHSVTHLRYSLR